MASIFNHAFDEPITASRGTADAAPWQALQINVGRSGSISLSYEEDQRLVVDLQRELAAVEAAARGATA
jgi:hypothetical protein